MSSGGLHRWFDLNYEPTMSLTVQATARAFRTSAAVAWFKIAKCRERCVDPAKYAAAEPI
eukprot:7085599-Prymnesium_polylepis.1